MDVNNDDGVGDESIVSQNVDSTDLREGGIKNESDVGSRISGGIGEAVTSTRPLGESVIRT